MKRVFVYIGIIFLFVASAVVITETSFPKNSGQYLAFIVVGLIDIYLWWSIRKDFTGCRGVRKFLFGTFYWLPFSVILSTAVVSLFYPVSDWESALSTYLFGGLFVFYAAKFLAVIFFFLADIYSIVIFTFKFVAAKNQKKPFDYREKRSISRGKFLRTVGLAGGGLLFSGMLIGIVKWAYDFRIRRHTIRLPNLASSFSGMKIVQISDLHLGSWIGSEPLDEAVDMINSLDPDIILFTGDLVNSSTEEAIRYSDQLKRLQAKFGVYASLGNHDYGDYIDWAGPEQKKENLEKLFGFYEEIGWKLLNNSNELLVNGSDQFAVVGVENWSSLSRFPQFGDLSKALKGTEDASVRILLSHDPTHWEKIVSQDYPEVDVTFSGHTHGFQFGVELKGFRWSFAQYVYKYWAGLYENRNSTKAQYLYVNRGLGMVGYPGRVGILPEITLVTLTT